MKKKLSLLVGILLLIGAFIFIGFAKAEDPFFNQASQANLAEIEAGKLAVSTRNCIIDSYPREYPVQNQGGF